MADIADAAVPHPRVVHLWSRSAFKFHYIPRSTFARFSAYYSHRLLSEVAAIFRFAGERYLQCDYKHAGAKIWIYQSRDGAGGCFLQYSIRLCRIVCDFLRYSRTSTQVNCYRLHTFRSWCAVVCITTFHHCITTFHHILLQVWRADSW